MLLATPGNDVWCGGEEWLRRVGLAVYQSQDQSGNICSRVVDLGTLIGWSDFILVQRNTVPVTPPKGAARNLTFDTHGSFMYNIRKIGTDVKFVRSTLFRKHKRVASGLMYSPQIT